MKKGKLNRSSKIQTRNQGCEAYGKNGMLVCMLISRANKERYRDIMIELLNGYAKGINDCPSVDKVEQFLNINHFEKQPGSMQMMQTEMELLRQLIRIK